jgi:hypothetical protein
MPNPAATPELLAAIESGTLGDPLVLVAYLAGQGLSFDPAELNAAQRRALLLRATAGDPRRELEIDDRGVRALALDLFSPARRAELAAGLDALSPLVGELQLVREAVVFLASDLDLAWRLFALALLAEALAESD